MLNNNINVPLRSIFIVPSFVHGLMSYNEINYDEVLRYSTLWHATVWHVGCSLTALSTQFRSYRAYKVALYYKY